MTHATLLVSCVDRTGIVATLAQALFAAGANILDADQHTDEVANMFFQRIRFDLGPASVVALEDAIAGVARELQLTWRIAYARARPRVAIFVSKQEHCLYDLLVRHRARELACDIVGVLSNHDDARGIATHFGIAYHHIDPKADPQTFALLDEPQLRPDLIVLARYMQILSPAFVARYPNRIINIHHSFLPAFVGANPYRQAHDKGVKLIGATAHYVTADLDQGPIIDQETVHCSHRDSVDDLVRKGRDLEKRTLANAVRLHLEDRILVHAHKTVVFA